MAAVGTCMFLERLSVLGGRETLVAAQAQATPLGVWSFPRRGEYRRPLVCGVGVAEK